MSAVPAVDCHCHIIDPAHFPFAPRGGYRPLPDEVGTREALEAAMDANGVRHALLVQPSCYGTDNRAVLDSMARRPGRFKAISVLDPETSDKELAALRSQGVVGVRLNLPFDPQALERAAAASFLTRLKRRDMVVQVHGRDVDWVAAAPILRRSGIRLVIDHLGLETSEGGLQQPGFQSVLSLGRELDAVIKLSAPFRASRRPPPFDDLDPLFEAVLETFGVARCVWGSDWPFLGLARRPGYADALTALSRWLPDESARRAVLWDNPRRLFGFGGDVAA